MKRSDDREDPRRRIIVQALTAWMSALGLPPGLAQAASALGGTPSIMPENRSIYRLTGTVKVNGIVASTETRIFAGDTVETGKSSEIVFVVGGTSMILRENSHVKLDPAPKDMPSSIITSLRLLTGKLLSVHGKGRPVKMETLVATIGIRGTVFDTAVGELAVEIARREKAVPQGTPHDPDTATLAVLRGPEIGRAHV